MSADRQGVLGSSTSGLTGGGVAGHQAIASPTIQSPAFLPSAHLGLAAVPTLNVPDGMMTSGAAGPSGSSSSSSSSSLSASAALTRQPSTSSRRSISQASSRADSSNGTTRVPSDRLTPNMLPPLSTSSGQGSGSSGSGTVGVSRQGSVKGKERDWSAAGLLRKTSKGKGKGKEEKLGEFGWGAHAGDGWKSPMSETGSSEVIETPQMTSSRDPETGRKMINQYLVLHEIGRGTHGTVRLGRDMSVDLPAAAAGEPGEAGQLMPPSPPHAGSFPSAPFYAIKMVDRVPRRKKLQTLRKGSALGLGGMGGLAGSKTDAKLLVGESEIRKEIAIFKKVNHPNIVRMKEIIDDPVQSKIFMVLEYCQGGEIKWKEDDGSPALSVADTRKIMRDTLLGLEYLHHQGIIHRDIKPSNLLIAGDDRVKISDFGCSHYSEALREASALPGPEGDRYVDDIELAKTAGSPAFFAPEMCYSGIDDETDTRSLSPARTPNQETMPAFILRPPSVLVDANGDRMASCPVTLSPSGRPVPLQSTLSSESIPRGRPGAAGPPPSAVRTQSSASIARRKDRLPITNAIDVWALGVTLYCLLFGRTPFDAPNEYLLMQVIPTMPYDIPPIMGRDRLDTRNNPEAREAIDLLSRLLEKDPGKRITLDKVKKHPFILRGLADASNWLVSTDLHAQTFVTVSNDEVAAAVTKSSSFRDRLRRGMKAFGTKLQILGGAGHAGSRKAAGGDATPADASGAPSNDSSATPSTAASSVSLQGTPRQGASRFGLNEFGQRDGATPLASPNPPGTPSGSIARRLSIFGSRLGGGGGAVEPQPRSAGPEATPARSASLLAPTMDRAVSADPSMEGGASATPQHGFVVHRPLSRSTHVPSLQPVADATSPRKTTSTTSLDKLRTNGGKVSRENSMQRRQSSDNDAFGRQRSPSNASSGARSGLSGKIARLLSRNGSQGSRTRKRAGTGRSDHDQAVSERYLGERDRDAGGGGQADSTDDHAVTTASGGTSPAERFRRLSVGDDLGRKSLDTFDSGSMSSRLGVGSAGNARVLGSASGSTGGYSYPSPDRAGGMLGLPDWEARLRSSSAQRYQHDRRGSSATSAMGDDHEPEEYDYNERLDLSDDEVDEPMAPEGTAGVPTHLISPISPVGGGPAGGAGSGARDRLPDVVTPPHVHALQANQTSQAAFFSHHTLGANHTHHHGKSPLGAPIAGGGLELDLTADDDPTGSQEHGTTRSILVPPSAAVERKHSFSHVSAAPTLEAIPDASPPSVSTGISVYSFSSSSRDDGSPLQRMVSASHSTGSGSGAAPPQAAMLSRSPGKLDSATVPRTPPATTQAHLQPSPGSSSGSPYGSNGDYGRRSSSRVSTSPTTRTHGAPERAKSPLGRMFVNHGDQDDDDTDEREDGHFDHQWTGRTTPASGRLGASPGGANYSPVRSRPVRDAPPLSPGGGRNSPIRFAVENGDSPSPKARSDAAAAAAAIKADDDDDDDGALAINTANRRGRKGSLYGRRQPTAVGVTGEASPAPGTARLPPSPVAPQSHRGSSTVA